MEETQDRSKQALNKLADYLSRKDHSVLELKTKLGQTFEPDEIEWAIDEAQKQNWLSDPEDLAKRVALSLQRKRKGILHVNSYLDKKGLPSIDLDWDIDYKNAQSLLFDKFGEKSSFSDEEKQKAYRYLNHRGYNEEIIHSVVSDGTREPV